MKKLMMITLMILIAVTITVLPCCAENNIYGCYQKNNGQLRIVNNVSECRPSEASISWNQIGPQGPQGVAGPQGPAGPPGPGGIEVYDANDQFLGYTLAFPTTMGGTVPGVLNSTIHIPKLEKRISIQLNLSTIGSPSFPTFFYTTPDCSGVAYSSPIASYQIIASCTDFPPSPSSPCPQVFYVGEGPPQYLTILSGSITYPLLSGDDCLPPPGGGPNPNFVVPLTQVSLPFTTPVALPLKYKFANE